MTHLRVFTYNDKLSPSSPGGPIEPDPNEFCTICRPYAGHIYVAGTEPALPIHEEGHDTKGNRVGGVGVCECYYVEVYTADEPILPTHTHQDLLDQLTVFGVWLDEMEKQLSDFAATLLDLATRVCVDIGAE